jgi:hypothetical protein
MRYIPTYAVHVRDVVYRLTSIVIQDGDYVSGETVVHREGIPQGGECRAKVPEFVTVKSPSQIFDTFTSFSIYCSKFAEWVGVEEMGHLRMKVSHDGPRWPRKDVFLERR